MAGEREIVLRFKDEAENIYFNRVMAERPDLERMLLAGIEQAAIIAPGIRAGHYGLTAEAIDAKIALLLRRTASAMRKGPQHERADDDMVLCYCAAFEAACREPRDAFLAVLAVAAKTSDALMLMAAATEAAEAAGAMARAAGLVPAPHALAVSSAPSRRLLRPEDFGALPSRPRA